MHTARALVLSLGLTSLALVGSLSGCERASADGVARVDGPRARELVAAGATLLDVRTAPEFAGGHIEGALNIPVAELASRRGEVPRGRVVVYCQSGGRSARAAGLLASAGYDVFDLGAMASW